MTSPEKLVPLDPERWVYAFYLAHAAVHMQTPVPDPQLPPFTRVNENTGQTETYTFDNTPMNRAFLKLHDEFDGNEFTSAGIRFMAFMRLLTSRAIGEPWVTGPDTGPFNVSESLIRAAALSPVDAGGNFSKEAILKEASQLEDTTQQTDEQDRSDADEESPPRH